MTRSIASPNSTNNNEISSECSSKIFEPEKSANLAKDSHPGKGDIFGLKKFKIVAKNTHEIFGKSDTTDYTPFKLSSKKPGLFPEFYFYFKESFSSENPNNRAYLSVNKDKAWSLVSPDKKDRDELLVTVEKDFNLRFKACLDSTLLKKYDSWVFTREIVASIFAEKMAGQTDFVSVPSRRSELIEKFRQTGAFMPLLNFFLASRYPESDIWREFLQIVCTDCTDEAQVELINGNALKWKDSGCCVKCDLAGFVKSLRKPVIPEQIQKTSESGECPSSVIDQVYWDKLGTIAKYGESWIGKAVLNEYSRKKQSLAPQKAMKSTFKKTSCFPGLFTALFFLLLWYYVMGPQNQVSHVVLTPTPTIPEFCYHL